MSSYLDLCVVGIDQSLTHSGIQAAMGRFTGPGCTVGEMAALIGSARRSAVITDMQSGPKAKSRKAKPKAEASCLLEHAVARIQYISEAWEAKLSEIEFDNHGPGSVYMEGYAMGSSFGREALGEVGGAIKRIAYARGWHIYVCAPTSLKKYILESGKGEKELVMATCVKRWGYMPTDNNDADAYGLMRLGIDHQLHKAGRLKANKLSVEVFDKLTYYAPHSGKAA